MKKTALVLGAGGFIGSHLVKRLKEEKYYVVGADLKFPEFSESLADQFWIKDLRDVNNVSEIFQNYRPDEVYQLAAMMGGAGFIFTGENDALVMTDSASINLAVANVAAFQEHQPKVFFSSSACVYNEFNQADPDNPICTESSAYPANPDSAYGWEKLFSERLYQAYHRNYGLDVKIARFHNIFGEEGVYNNGKEKAPAAICRKVAEVEDGGKIEIWGDGQQTRSFLYIDECLEGVRRLMNSNVTAEPINIGSDEMVSINTLVEMVAKIANKKITIKHIDGPLGVRGRCSNNALIGLRLGWRPSYPLELGLKQTYAWIKEQVNKTKNV